MRLLLVEDELEIQRFLTHSLTKAGYQVDAARDARNAMRCVDESTYDVVIVDRGLPDQDGITLILSLRRVGVKAPILILSARRSVDEMIEGLDEADDYMTKPFALGELVARLRNLLRRDSSGHNSVRLRVNDLEMDLIQREVTRSGRTIRLTAQEFMLLELLCRNAGQIVTRSMILERIWGIRFEPKTNVLDVHMSRLRGKVDGVGREPLIETLRGKGYVLRHTGHLLTVRSTALCMPL